MALGKTNATGASPARIIKYDNSASGLAAKNVQAALDELKSDIPTIPSSLPANGGNADTVDGKHASDFAASGHDHDAVYYKKTEADSKVASDISDHNTSEEAHNDIRSLISDLVTKLNNFLDVDDTTTDQLSEVITLINNNKGTLESLTTSKINVSDIVDNLTTSNASKVLSAKQGVAIKSLIDALQTAVNGKANANHDHDSDYAAVDHDHSVSDITDFPTSLPANGGNADTVDGKHADAFALAGHNHDADYADIDHGHTAAEVGAAPEANGLYHVTSAGNGAAYTATVPGITSLEAGATFVLIPHVVSSSNAPTLNVNGLGAKTLRQQLSTGSVSTVAFSSASWLSAGKPVIVVYNGTYWVVQIARPDCNTLYGTTKIENGGTGASTAEGAILNLETENLKVNRMVPATSSDGTAYTATVPGVTELYAGLRITIIPDRVSAALTPTLNINNLGAKNIIMPIDGVNTSITTNAAKLPTWLGADQPVELVYDGTRWKSEVRAQSAQYMYGNVPVDGGGTGADTAEEALANLGGISKKLLWANADSTSQFLAQNISINWSEYDKIGLEYRYSDDNYNSQYDEISCVEGLHIAMIMASLSTNRVPQIAERYMVLLADNKVGFIEGYLSLANNNAVSNNWYCIPIRIWGIKGVQ